MILILKLDKTKAFKRYNIFPLIKDVYNYIYQSNIKRLLFKKMLQSKTDPKPLNKTNSQNRP